MRKAFGIGGFGAIALAAMFMLTTVPMAGAVWADDTTVDLMAGQNDDAGDIHVWHDAAYFYVEITMQNDWVLIDAVVAMSVDDTPDTRGCDLNGIPQNKQHKPVPGHFPYDPYDADGDGASFKISFIDVGFEDHNDDFQLGYDEICIAVHANVEKGEGDDYQQQTAWGDGTEFGKSWAMYFCYMPSAVKRLTLPDTIYADIQNPGSASYWGVEIITGSGDASAGMYLGWCIDKVCYITEGKHTFEVIPYYDTANIPSDETGNYWNQINYILNNPGSYTPGQIQDAIWYFSNDIAYGSLGAAAKALVDDANANGASFLPRTGDWMAVILYIEGKQTIIIEIDP
jgi:hypothetical protein